MISKIAYELAHDYHEIVSFPQTGVSWLFKSTKGSAYVKTHNWSNES